MKNPVQLISAQEQLISSLEGEISILTEKLQFAKAKLEGMREIYDIPTYELMKPKIKAMTKSHAASPPKGRQIGDKWQIVFRFIESNPGSTIHEILNNLDAKDYSRKLLQTQLSYYAKQGHLNNIDGKYAITDSGRIAAGIQKEESPNQGAFSLRP